MLKITNFFWQMCLLQKSPADIPASNFATALVFSVYLIVAFSVVSVTRPAQAFTAMVGTIAIGLALTGVVTFSLLQFKGYINRFRATFSALLGTNTIMLVVLLPFNFIILKSENESLVLFADSATWICLGWWLAIAGHIYHKSVEVSILQGSAIAFLVELLGVIIAFSLFPAR